MLEGSKLDDARFIIRLNWPKWPYCPMKNRIVELEGKAGVLVDQQELGKKTDPKHPSLRTVFLANPWAVWEGELKLKDCEKKEYASIEDMLNDGWEVD